MQTFSRTSALYGFARIALLFVCAFMMSIWSGCAVPKTPVVTVWQELGFPQGRARLRDNFRNRSGRFPQREWKPPKRRIADLANFEPQFPGAKPSDLLKGAAEIKIEQDLAPQKIKALKFLCGVACGCNTETVEKAVIAGLEDCVADVRREALTVVLASTGGACCEKKRRSVRKKLIKCNLCAGRGCGGCRGCGMQETTCEVEVPCQSCGACCGRKVQEKLEQMAYKQKDDGCWYEPLEELRSMAANALNLCPALPPKTDPDPTIKKGTTPDEDEGEGGTTPVEGTGGTGTTPTEDEGKQSKRRTPKKTAAELLGPAPSKNMVPAMIHAISEDGSRLQIKLDRPYAFPNGSNVIVSRPNGLQIDIKIIKSGEGIFDAEADPDDRQIMLENLPQGTPVWIGVLGG